jgi:hypothetical protein
MRTDGTVGAKVVGTLERHRRVAGSGSEAGVGIC